MKLGFVVNTFPCLSQTFVWDQIQGMLNLGQEIHVFARNKSEGKFQPNEHLHVHYEPDLGFKSCLNTLKFFLKKPTAFYKITLNLWNLRGCNIYRFLIALDWYCNGIIQEIDSFVIHFGPNGLRFQVMKDLGLIRCPLFVFFHGYDVSEILKLRGSGYYNKLFKGDSFLLPISRYWAKILCDNGAPINNILVHHMGVDIESFKFKESFPRQKFVVVSVSRLVEKKGLSYALDAFSILKDRGISFFYKIIGSGPLEYELKKKVSSLGLEGFVCFLGSKIHSEIEKELDSSDIFLLPSVTAKNGDQEGIPVSIMEAMAVGLPVVSTYHSGIPELIQNGFNGVLVAERDSGALSEGILELINDFDKYREYSLNARKTIENNFCLSVLNKKLLDHIYGVFNDK